MKKLLLLIPLFVLPLWAEDPQPVAPPQTPAQEAQAAKTAALNAQAPAYEAFDAADDEITTFTDDLDAVALEWADWAMMGFSLDASYWTALNDAYIDANDLSDELHDWVPDPPPNYYPGTGPGLVGDLYRGDDAISDGDDFYTGGFYVKAKDEYVYAESSYVIVGTFAPLTEDAAAMAAYNFYINVYVPSLDEYEAWLYGW